MRFHLRSLLSGVYAGIIGDFFKVHKFAIRFQLQSGVLEFCRTKLQFLQPG